MGVSHNVNFSKFPGFYGLLSQILHFKHPVPEALVEGQWKKARRRKTCFSQWLWHEDERFIACFWTSKAIGEESRYSGD